MLQGRESESGAEGERERVETERERERVYDESARNRAPGRCREASQGAKATHVRAPQKKKRCPFVNTCALVCVRGPRAQIRC